MLAYALTDSLVQISHRAECPAAARVGKEAREARCHAVHPLLAAHLGPDGLRCRLSASRDREGAIVVERRAEAGPPVALEAHRRRDVQSLRQVVTLEESIKDESLARGGTRTIDAPMVGGGED